MKIGDGYYADDAAERNAMYWHMLNASVKTYIFFYLFYF